ncbi:MAG: glycosyltransferase family 4 protein [Candidatus Omnitrophica bacterium]|nr:glycosyltransferase family 4 protein [Candidatus Omnitrophota bacterium]
MGEKLNKILLVSYSYKPRIGGLELFVENLAQNQLLKGIDVKIITSRFKKDEKKSERISGLVVERLMPNLFWGENGHWLNNILIFPLLAVHFKSALNIYKSIARFKPQVITICYPTPPAIYFILFGRLLRIPIVVALHGEIVLNVPTVCMVEKILFKFILSNANYVTACSKSILEEAAKFAPRLKKSSSYIYNGVSLGGSSGPPLTKERIHKNNYILSIANLWPYKGIDILLMAMKRVYEKGYQSDLIVIGEGDQRDKLEKMISFLRLEGKVFLKGKVDNENEKNNFLNNCEFFVLPSRVEPFGIVNLEAMAAGKAIVGTRSGGIPEIVKDGINGILVDPFNDIALSEGIMRLLDDCDLSLKMGLRGKEIAQDKAFSWGSVTEQYIEVQKKVLIRE